jgi:hypothetical protein
MFIIVIPKQRMVRFCEQHLEERWRDGRFSNTLEAKRELALASGALPVVAPERNTICVIFYADADNLGVQIFVNGVR